LSLAVILVTLVVTTVASLAKNRRVRAEQVALGDGGAPGSAELPTGPDPSVVPAGSAAPADRAPQREDQPVRG
jgi:tellurite resistance protein TerC